MVTILAADQCLQLFKVSWYDLRFLTSYQAGIQARIFPVDGVN